MALKLTNVKSGCTHQAVKIKPDSAYYVTALIKIEGKADGAMGVQWRNTKGRWHAHFRNLSLVPIKDEGNGWKRAIAVIDSIPPDTSHMHVMLNMGSPGKESTVYFDEVEIREVYLTPQKKGKK